MDPRLAPGVWSTLEPLFKGALERASCKTHEPIDILMGILQGALVLWPVWHDGNVEAVCVTEIQQYPRLRKCHVFLCAGRRIAEWYPEMQATLEDYARAQGCTRWSCFGRDGWERHCGMERVGTMFEKDL